ncbi:alpha-glucan family phosphorylase [Aquihabitans sp. McL0605]|uniref:alpha-glucan family phosphorylase n=1 Tax=Aquihabitans sp. McL0605 TaxID=3415671 RepID=UPI003CEBF3A2
MRALRSFTVRPHLPEALAPLQELAMNLRWAWDDRTRDLFRWVDPDAWDATRHDPISTLATTSPERLAELAADPAFLRYQASVHEDLTRYLEEPRWFQNRTSALRQVAYFSPEFGIAEALPQYSGGLGILAGDHLKSASDLGVPLVGVGLFYRHGYFRQGLDSEGWQQERFPDQDPFAMPLTLCEGVRIQVELAGAPLQAQVWRADVGRIPLYLLDTDVDENPDELRGVTDRLYGGDVEHRLRQEILLGIGGVRALEALGVDAQVFHTNEGHAGFLGLERMRRAIVEHGLTFDESVEATRAASIFTTHTPVPAGIDRFPRALIEQYFGSWAAECGIDIDQLMSLGHRPSEEAAAPDDERFNMAVMGLRLAGRSNAVAKLHGAVSREMFNELWPDLDADEVPITSVTNGVHSGTWVSADMSDLLARHVLPEWDEASPESWERVWLTPDDELWRVKEQARARLVAFVRLRVKLRAIESGISESEAQWADDLLDPHALTIGFARRFATYKRANLLLAQAERLQDLLLSPDQPVQFIFAGKAHPADDEGKKMISQIVNFAKELGVRHRFIFLDDYDISVARTLYQGADIWLNTPRRPQEACGTSGMKAALNGTLNCSILDGWWDEMFDGDNGWAITSAEDLDDLGARDQIEADSLFDLLEHQIVPLFHDRPGGAAGDGWLRRVKSNLVSLGPAVVASRMVRDYTTELYEPTAAAADSLRGDEFARAKELARWKERVRAAWGGVKVTEVDASDEPAELGAERTISVTLELGSLSPTDVAVQLIHGRVGQHDELVDTATTDLACADPSAHPATYSGTVTCTTPGRYGFTVRAIPTHADLPTPVDLGLTTLA